MKTLLFYLVVISGMSLCTAQEKETIVIDSEFGVMKLIKKCTTENNITVASFVYQVSFFFEDPQTENFKDTIRVSVQINEAGEICSYEIRKQPLGLDFYRTITNFFKDIIAHRKQTGNKNLSCGNKALEYTFTFSTG